MNCIFFEDKSRSHLLPLTFTKPVASLRIGILTIAEKWIMHLDAQYSYLTQAYLAQKFPLIVQNENFLINGSVLPDMILIDSIVNLPPNSVLMKSGIVLAANASSELAATFDYSKIEAFNQFEYTYEVRKIEKPWDLFSKNEDAIRYDFDLLTATRVSEPISSTNKFRNPDRIFIEKGATVEFSVLDPGEGCIYIGSDAEIMAGSLIHGSLALCEHAVLKMGAKIYGATTIGPYSKVGGEINNSVITGYSNKAHDGFLGNSVIGEWCNLGADSNNSNLKNNYAEVKLWSYEERKFAPTGLQFCGLIMGDHSKCGINTMFNTGTVVGVSANIFGSGFPRNFIPSFSWGGAHGFTEFAVPKANEVATLVMQRRAKSETEIAQELEILAHVFEITKEWRK